MQQTMSQRIIPLNHAVAEKAKSRNSRTPFDPNDGTPLAGKGVASSGNLDFVEQIFCSTEDTHVANAKGEYCAMDLCREIPREVLTGWRRQKIQTAEKVWTSFSSFLSYPENSKFKPHTLR